MKLVSLAMQFKHPELLYALLLLVIPLIVHLFQLRKFRTEKFTNVKFLKKAVQQTRKSSRLQKWLVLFTRMLLLASLVIAFSQPYFPGEENKVETETVIYLDNSYSMQAKGKNGILLKRGIQDLLENLPKEGEISLFTNSEEFRNINVQSLRKKLQEMKNSPAGNSWDNVVLKANNLFSQQKDTQKNFIAISDFQQEKKIPESIENVETYLVQLKPENRQNISLDTAYVQSKSLDEIVLTINLSATNAAEVPVAIYDGDKPLAKKTVALGPDLQNSTEFTLPATPIVNGRIVIEDNGLSFDNELFFSINPIEAVKVVVVGDEHSEFLKRIYTTPEFELKVFSEDNLEFNALTTAEVVLLNEINSLSPALSDQLASLDRENVLLVVIPSKNANLEQLNPFLQKLGLPQLREKIEQEKLITRITFEHPLFENVFNEKVQNFQYPRVDLYFRISAPATNVLSFETGQPFLLEHRNNFLFTSPLNDSVSNFKSSPLVVPTFYNFGNLSVTPDELYFVLGNDKEITIQASLEKDEILKISSPTTTFIPQQQSFQNLVRLNLDDDPVVPGHYTVMRDSLKLKTLSFNLDRGESVMEYSDLKTSENLQVYQNVPEVFDELESQNEVGSLWKWFVIFAMIFLLTEMLILKFLK